jgi:hypothetical protein
VRRSAITAILVRGRAWPHNGTQGYVWVAGSHLFGWYEVGPASGQAVCRGANKRTAGKGRWHPQGRPDARGWYQRCPKGRFSGYAALSSLSSPRATILSALSCNGPLQRILERDELATARQRDRIVKPSFLSAISSHPQILRMPRQPTAVKKSAANNKPINFQAVCRSAYAVSRLAPCTTLGRPLESPGFAGCQVPVDPRQRMACQAWRGRESVQRVSHGRDQTPAPIEKQLRLRRLTV